LKPCCESTAICLKYQELWIFKRTLKKSKKILRNHFSQSKNNPTPLFFIEILAHAASRSIDGIEMLAGPMAPDMA